MDSHIRGILRSKLLFLLCVALMIAGGAAAAFTRYMEDVVCKVTLNDNGHVVQVFTMEETVGELLDKYDIELGPGDKVTPGLDVKLQNDTAVNIVRAFKVYVEADRRIKKVYMTEGTVKDALDEANVALGDKDLINHRLDEDLAPGTFIKVTRIGQKTIVEKEAIPYKVVTRKNHHMDEGVERIVQEGRQGELQRKILVAYRDGIEVSRKVVEEKVVSEPVDRIVEKGTVKTLVTSRGDKIRYTEVMTMVATAYTAGYESTGKNPGDPYYGITNSGKPVKSYHTIAAPKWVPFGTKVYIPYMVEFWRKRGVEISGIFVVEDRGSAIKGNRIDIYIEDLETCHVFGKRRLKVYFLK